MRGVSTMIGPPGTGKTTRVAELVEEIYQAKAGMGTPAIVVSLTKAAAAEAAGRDLPIGPKAVGTLHSFAYRALGAPEIAESKAKEFGEEFPELSFDTSGTASDLDEPSWERSGKVGFSKEGVVSYQTVAELRAREIPRDSPAWAGVRDFDRAWETWKADNELLDFTDLVDRARVEACPLDPSVIIVDEAQDLSSLELSLLRRWTVDGAEGLVLVGDPLQSLYAWRGAHPELFNDPRVLGDRRTVLHQSYRVPRAVHRAACMWASDLLDRFDVRYEPRDAEGETGFVDASWKHPSAVVDWACDRVVRGESVMLQASCSYMLDPLVRELRARAVPFANPWRRKRGDWNPLARGSRLRNLLDAPSLGRLWTPEELASWVEPLQAAKALRRGAKATIRRLGASDQAVPFDLLLEWFGGDALSDLFDRLDPFDAPSLASWWFERLSPTGAKTARYGVEVVERRGLDAIREEPRIFVGSVHSFKGAEADTVLTFPDLSPLGWAELQRGGDGRDAVTRLGYVALTRARERCFVARALTQHAMDLPV